jgi:hypothetical protein
VSTDWIATLEHRVKQSGKLHVSLGTPRYKLPGSLGSRNLTLSLAMRWEKKTEQVRVSLSVSDLELIDQYAERKRLLTRPEAIRQLLHKGLIAVGSLPDDE